MSDFGNDWVPSTPELCMQTVEDYSQDKFSKVETIRSVFAAFYESAEYQNTSSDELNVAIGTYLAMFDQHDASRWISAERGTKPDLDQNMKMKTLLQRIGPRDLELDPPLHRGLQKSEPLTRLYFPGSHPNLQRTYSSLPVKNSWGKWSKTISNGYPNFLTWNGTMSLPENPSTSTLSSPECTPLQPTAGPLRTSENSNSTLEPTSQQNRLRLTETGSSPGESHSVPPNLFSPTEKKNSKNILNTSLPTLDPYIPALIGRYSNLTKPFVNASGPSTTSPSMSSANSDTSRPVTSTGMALAKAVPNPSRKRLRNPELDPPGDRPTHAGYGTMASARKKPRLANIGTSAKSVGDRIARVTAIKKRSEALEHRGHHLRFAWQLIWDTDIEQIGPTAMYSLTAEPLPRPPPSAFTETSLKTISKNPDLFKITCLIHVNVFEGLLLHHTNPLFCQSVLTSLRDGFWPWPENLRNIP